MRNGWKCNQRISLWCVWLYTIHITDSPVCGNGVSVCKRFLHTGNQENSLCRSGMSGYIHAGTVDRRDPGWNKSRRFIPYRICGEVRRRIYWGRSGTAFKEWNRSCRQLSGIDRDYFDHGYSDDREILYSSAAKWRSSYERRISGCEGTRSGVSGEASG